MLKEYAAHGLAVGSRKTHTIYIYAWDGPCLCAHSPIPHLGGRKLQSPRGWGLDTGGGWTRGVYRSKGLDTGPTGVEKRSEPVPPPSTSSLAPPPPSCCGIGFEKRLRKKVGSTPHHLSPSV